VSFLARHTFSLLSTATFAVFACLVLWAYNNDLEHLTLPPPQPAYPIEHSHIITAYHNRPETPNISYALANILTHNPIKKVAFAILLSFKPQHTLLTAYAHHAQFGAVQSLSKAAPYYFGVSVNHLSIGETLLLLKLAHNPTLPITDPITTLQLRDALLTDLYTHKNLTPTQYQTERHKALALTADHRPIN
jgi:hypothetical protein